ncbi:MAG: cation-translocating P-type ATPase [Candidatus Promineifilaceae bacterium]|nr:cation-translocating P-type ATPase [Candidatus Promineifilaceae bacterium]
MATNEKKRIEIPVKGMDCAQCATHVRDSLRGVHGVGQAEVYLGAEKAVVEPASDGFDLAAAHKAIRDAGYEVGEKGAAAATVTGSNRDLSKQVTYLTGALFLFVLLVAIVGEGLGLFERLSDRMPWWIGLLIVLAGGYPVFKSVAKAAVRRRIISHTLMTLGVLAAVVVGEWITAILVVFFMRVGDYVEQFTSDRARQAVRRLSDLAPQTARLIADGAEREVPIEQVAVGDHVIVRPGERIPVDGTVVTGQATIDQSAITGESMPVEVEAGSRVFAASFAHLGSIEVETAQVGDETTFGRVIRLVEEAEANRGEVQRFADRFSGYYLPIVASIAALTYLISGNALATAAVLVVACSCSIALATPIAMLASIGAAARRGLLIKGGKVIEVLDRADVLLIDKTGTLTLGRPRVTDIKTLNGLGEDTLLTLAASAEWFSEHPLATAVCDAAQDRGLELARPTDFVAIPGKGVRATVAGQQISVGSQRLMATTPSTEADALAAQGKTVLYVSADNEVAGLLAVSDTLRPEVPAALRQVRALGIKGIELLTGDNESAAAGLAEQLAIDYRAELLPEDKIAIVKEYQQQGHVVVMVGDGVNDAPALAQADVGIAMGAAGTDVALEAAHAALMRDDWLLIPELLEVAERTMDVVRLNLGFTAVYNAVGLGLAAFGILPPVLAAAAQSLPDIGILANSSRLLRQGASAVE